VLFAFGTVFFYVAVQGTVWFTALTLGVFCTVAYLHGALDARHPFLAGLFLGMAFLCRPLLLLAGVFFVFQLWYDREKGWKNPFSGEALIKMALFLLPVLAVGGLMMSANLTRFENPFEFGHLYLPAVYDRANQYGLFSLHWLPRNLYAFFLAPPQIMTGYPYVRFNAHGMSLFLTTPLFLALFFKGSNKSTRPLFVALGMTALVVMLPALFYQNTGWVTFGNRFSVDYTPFLVVMLALSRLKTSLLFQALLWWSLLINGFGALIFGRAWIFFHTSYESMDWIYLFLKNWGLPF
jgi:hypothetical protein